MRYSTGHFGSEKTYVDQIQPGRVVGIANMKRICQRWRFQTKQTGLRKGMGDCHFLCCGGNDAVKGYSREPSCPQRQRHSCQALAICGRKTPTDVVILLLLLQLCRGLAAGDTRGRCIRQHSFRCNCIRCCPGRECTFASTLAAAGLLFHSVAVRSRFACLHHSIHTRWHMLRLYGACHFCEDCALTFI